jgi:hypothetical protein
VVRRSEPARWATALVPSPLVRAVPYSLPVLAALTSLNPLVPAAPMNPLALAVRRSLEVPRSGQPWLLAEGSLGNLPSGPPHHLWGRVPLPREPRQELD